MYETKEWYVFMTFQDGKVVWYKDSYKKHCDRHSAIADQEGREAIEKALIYPDYISEYSQRNSFGKVFAKCKKYRTLTNVKNKSGWEYWEIILKRCNGQRKKIATAYLTNSPNPSYIVNDRIENVRFLSDRIKQMIK